MRKKTYRLIPALLAAALLCACGGTAQPAVTVDPYEGMVNVESGYGNRIWVELYEDVPASDLEAASFRTTGGRVEYTGGAYTALQGVDVSEHQGDIDWVAVAGDDIDFAVIRAGYRGYSQGGLYEDEYFKQNIEGALENGVRVGVYFFSQAVNTDEAVEEADYLLELISGYDVEMPVIFDWESIGSEEARTDGLDGKTLTDCALAFCARIAEAGYKTGVYAYRYLGYFSYDLPRLNGQTLWIGALGSAPDFYYSHSIWQYTDSGNVDGIEGDVDMNLMFVKNATETAASPEPDGTAPDTATSTKAPEAAGGTESMFENTTEAFTNKSAE